MGAPERRAIKWYSSKAKAIASRAAIFFLGVVLIAFSGRLIYRGLPDAREFVIASWNKMSEPPSSGRFKFSMKQELYGPPPPQASRPSITGSITKRKATDQRPQKVEPPAGSFQSFEEWLSRLIKS